jgi:hypothetical protein
MTGCRNKTKEKVDRKSKAEYSKTVPVQGFHGEVRPEVRLRCPARDPSDRSSSRGKNKVKETKKYGIAENVRVTSMENPLSISLVHRR